MTSWFDRTAFYCIVVCPTSLAFYILTEGDVKAAVAALLAGIGFLAWEYFLEKDTK